MLKLCVCTKQRKKRGRGGGLSNKPPDNTSGRLAKQKTHGMNTKTFRLFSVLFYSSLLGVDFRLSESTCCMVAPRVETAKKSVLSLQFFWYR